MIRYINTKFDGITETIDQVELEAFDSYWEFKKELNHLLHEYALSGNGSPWISSRACKDWK